MKTLKSNIARNLTTLRQLNKYSQEDVAEQIGVSRQAVAKWESGESVPDIVNCDALAQLYNVELNDLIHHDQEQTGLNIPPIEMENNPKKRYRLYEAAVGLYSGNLLPRLSDNIYFIPSITYYQGLYFRLAGRYIERQTECGEYVYAHKAAKAALAFDPFNSSLNMHLTILLYQQSGAGTANAFYTGIKRHLTEAHIQRIKQTCPNMII